MPGGNPFINTDQHKLPLFSDTSKDQVTAEDFCERVKAAALAGQWDNKSTIGNVRLVLINHAAEWFKALEYTRPEALDDLELFLKEFRKSFDKKEKPEDINRLLKGLQQKADEPVERFKNRCIVTLMKQESKLPHLADPDDIQDPAIRQQVKIAQKAARRQVLDNNLFHYFLGGLRPRIREKVLDKRVRTFDEAVDEALASETALDSGNNVVEKELPVLEMKQLQPKEGQTSYEQVDAFQAGRRGRGQYRGRRGQNGPARGQRGPRGGRGGPRPPWQRNNEAARTGKVIPTDQCAYCGVKGHWQRECRKRQSEGGQMKKVNYLEESLDRGQDRTAADPLDVSQIVPQFDQRLTLMGDNPYGYWPSGAGPAPGNGQGAR